MPGLFAAIAMFIKQLSLLVSYVKNNAFPQPLQEEEEAKHLKLFAEGNQHSRNLLIEHNLRLVAHIVKKIRQYRRGFGGFDLHRNNWSD